MRSHHWVVGLPHAGLVFWYLFETLQRNHTRTQKSDYEDRCVAICYEGEFTGGDLVIPALKQRFEFKPGDLAFRFTLLEHYIMLFSGERTSIVLFI